MVVGFEMKKKLSVDIVGDKKKIQKVREWEWEYHKEKKPQGR